MAKKSLAISMILQDNNKTLEDSEINALVDKVVDTLKNKFGAALRD
jgi:phenylalanyl-tRNA synthetase beta chain